MKSSKFLGYMLTKRGIEASPEQIKAIIKVKSPSSTKDIQRLTGRVVALNMFISRSSERCKPFYDILKKNKRFEWTEEHEKAFQPIDGKLFLLYLAVSSNAVSAVLATDLNGNQHPIYYVTKSLLDPETRYSHLEKLILALVTASTKLRHYFETHTIHVKTNYPIKNVMRKPEMS